MGGDDHPPGKNKEQETTSARENNRGGEEGVVVEERRRIREGEKRAGGWGTLTICVRLHGRQRTSYQNHTNCQSGVQNSIKHMKDSDVTEPRH